MQHTCNDNWLTFSHPDYTVGPGISPGHALARLPNANSICARGLYRRSGIKVEFHLSPCPEGLDMLSGSYLLNISQIFSRVVFLQVNYNSRTMGSQRSLGARPPFPTCERIWDQHRSALLVNMVSLSKLAGQLAFLKYRSDHDISCQAKV